MINLSNFSERIEKSVEFFEKIQEFKMQATGFIGESVFGYLAKANLSDDYYIISDVVLKYYNGTTQIDQIIVSKFGIFVVEVKTFKGWIWGNHKDEKWTQTLYGEKHSFQNPLRQNYKHIKALQNLLNFSDNRFKSLIVFSGEAIFRTDLPDNVVRGGEDYINFIKKHQTVIFSDNEVRETVKKIMDNRLSSAEHQAYMQKIKQKYDNTDKNNPPACPKCGKNMILRKSKKGYYEGREFWGCSGYPDCRAIVNIKKDSEKFEEKIRSVEKAFNFFFE
ncbi:MAG: NERD domain-containing protein [Desulfococcaceae bacterium]